jgi:hypothetical protein
MTKSPDPLAEAKRIMAGVLKLPPKPYSEMKIVKKKHGTKALRSKGHRDDDSGDLKEHRRCRRCGFPGAV